MRPGLILQEDPLSSNYVLCYMPRHGMPCTDVWRMKSIAVMSRGRRSVVPHEKSNAFSC